MNRVATLHPTPAGSAAPMTDTTTRRRNCFVSMLDFSPERLEACLALASRLKRERALGPCAPTASALAARHVALLFDKPSLRTRATFEVAIRELGGACLVLPADVGLGQREPIPDVARNLERWVHGVVIRTFAQQIVEDFAAAAPDLAVINALTDQEHPCQALADYQTLQEHVGTLAGRTIAYVGDGNNVATSLVHAGLMLGVSVHVASPQGYALPDAVIEQARQVARHDATVTAFTDPAKAVEGVVAVYTDVWTSMGQEEERAQRQRVFAPYQVNADLLGRVGRNAYVMHCLPAHRGEEVTADVLESPASLVLDQAENRLHAQKALLLMLLAPQYA
jgi:ornithine carbamoyltransferase